MKVPWKRVHSWKCLACGSCCKVYKPRLTFYEYLRLPKQYVEERRGKYYIRKINGVCPFQYGNLCMIQEKKPLSCKLFPFSIYERGEDEALFIYKGEEYYVYVDTFCKNLKLGKPSKEFINAIVEAIKIYKGEKTTPELITSRRALGTFFS